MSDFRKTVPDGRQKERGTPPARRRRHSPQSRHHRPAAPPSRWPKSVWRPRSRGIRTSSGRTGIGRICAVRQTMGEGDCIVKQLAVAPYCRAV
jgi:hypothetical protein